MRADNGQDLAIAVGGLPWLTTRLVDPTQSIVTVVNFGVAHQQFTRGLLGVVEPASVDEVDDRVGRSVKFVHFFLRGA